MDRRDFLVSGMGGLSVLVVGSAFSSTLNSPLLNLKEVQSLNFRITDALKNMVNHNEVNKAQCYFWVFKEERFPADCPGPIIFTTEGENIQVTVTNDLDENHNFFIKGVIDSGPISPGDSRTFSFTAGAAGTYLYHDSLNEPVNRVMGLHGALIVMPKAAVAGHRFTPYSNPTPNVQKLFDDYGGPLFPGLAWEEGDQDSRTASFRQNVWILHGASPKLFAEVGNHPPGEDYPAKNFVKAYTQDPYANTFETGRLNRKPHFFTINGQSGHFSHHNPYITPWRRVGEPVVIRILNAGLYTHSLHIHANHFYLLSINNEVQNNLRWLDTFVIKKMQTVEWTLPFHRLPDVPNKRGIGLPDPPLISQKGNPVWPPFEEMGTFLPPKGTLLGSTDISVQMSPLCYPMHDHTETTQTSQGGNYNTGLMAGIVFIGDRNVPGAMNFPNYPHEFEVFDSHDTRPCAPDIPGQHAKDER